MITTTAQEGTLTQSKRYLTEVDCKKEENKPTIHMDIADLSILPKHIINAKETGQPKCP